MGRIEDSLSEIWETGHVEDLWRQNFRLKSRSELSLHDRNSYSDSNCDCKDHCYFSVAFEKLGLEAEENSSEVMGPNGKSQETQTCHCDDCAREVCKNVAFKTREISTLRLVVQGPEVLNHQGIRHSPQDLAPFWKKDSRMWLWKSFRLARKRKSKTKSFVKFAAIDSGFDRT
ncbi:uncharacterized protein LOC135163680 isoform X2 [Diachasmimorpha longicaudata]|uniref:uncharacterized protein LOC135163680 isoform X2 n=1 Tax=Diachasmimorpha longicaudata TaxID=58733 RepID=UPI0030B88DB4